MELEFSPSMTKDIQKPQAIYRAVSQNMFYKTLSSGGGFCNKNKSGNKYVWYSPLLEKQGILVYKKALTIPVAKYNILSLLVMEK